MLLGFNTTIMAQTPTDTLTFEEIRSYVARNFSEARTFNLYWETNPSHSYTLKQNGNETEEGKMHYENTVKFAATVPIILAKKFSLYANGQANFYMFETSRNTDGLPSAIFPDNDENYSYYRGTLSGTYRTTLFRKPFILNATFSGDGWNSSFEKLQGTLSAIVVLKNTATTSFSVGLYGMTLFNQVPAFPIIAYSHQFNPHLSIDVTLPSRANLRYQFLNNHRLSLGASMESELFYLRPNIDGLPETCLYSKSNIKPEIVYEYIINKHFYLIARAGATQIIESGLYNTNRKGIDGDPYIEYTQPMTPFFNVGFSYNIFK
jgi:hypothetical protein